MGVRRSDTKRAQAFTLGQTNHDYSQDIAKLCRRAASSAAKCFANQCQTASSSCFSHSINLHRCGRSQAHRALLSFNHHTISHGLSLIYIYGHGATASRFSKLASASFDVHHCRGPLRRVFRFLYDNLGLEHGGRWVSEGCHCTRMTWAS